MKNIVCSIFLFIAFILVGCTESNLSINDFLQKLDNEEFVIGKKHEKIYSLIGAVDGFAVEIDGHKIQIYEYDISVKSGRSMISRIHDEGLWGRAVIRNKNLLLMQEPKHPEWDRILKAFNSL